MGEWKPLYFGLFIIMVIGVFLPAIVGSFVDLTDVEDTGIFSPVISLIQNGIDLSEFDITFFGFSVLPDFQFNIFDIMPDSVSSYLVDYLVSFSLIPLYITIPLFLTVVVGFTYTIFKLIRG